MQDGIVVLPWCQLPPLPSLPNAMDIGTGTGSLARTRSARLDREAWVSATEVRSGAEATTARGTIIASSGLPSIVRGITKLLPIASNCRFMDRSVTVVHRGVNCRMLAQRT